MSDQSHKKDCKHRNNLNQGFTNVNHVYKIVTISTISILRLYCVFTISKPGVLKLYIMCPGKLLFYKQS